MVCENADYSSILFQAVPHDSSFLQCFYKVAAGNSLYLEKQRFFKIFFYCCLYKVAAEQKARTTYDNILRLVKDPEVCEPIRFLREREIVHYQRFGEANRAISSGLWCKNSSLSIFFPYSFHIQKVIEYI